MRIAILTSGLGAGGAEQVIAQLAHHWCGASHRVDVITFDRPEDPIFHRLPEQVVLHRLGGRSGFAGMAGRVVALRRVLLGRGWGQGSPKERPQVIVSFLTKNNLIAALATLGTPTRLVCAERNNPERQGTHPLWNLLLRLLYRRADAIVCQTEAVRRCFPAAVQGKLVTIPNPVPAPDVARAAGEVKRVCAVGRLTHQKGFDLLITAFARVAPRWSDWGLDIWGDGPERAALEGQIRDLGLEGRVVLRGLSPRPRAWMAEAGIFVLSSRYEGFPNVLGEAMAAGLPVIATDCDFGPADMVEQGRSGILVPCESRGQNRGQSRGENPGALGEAISGLIADPFTRSRMGAAAAEAMARFQPARILREWDEVLANQVLAQAVSARQGGSAPTGVPPSAGRRAGAEG